MQKPALRLRRLMSTTSKSLGCLRQRATMTLPPLQTHKFPAQIMMLPVTLFLAFRQSFKTSLLQDEEDQNKKEQNDNVDENANDDSNEVLPLRPILGLIQQWAGGARQQSQGKNTDRNRKGNGSGSQIKRSQSSNSLSRRARHSSQIEKSASSRSFVHSSFSTPGDSSTSLDGEAKNDKDTAPMQRLTLKEVLNSRGRGSDTKKIPVCA